MGSEVRVWSRPTQEPAKERPRLLLIARLVTSGRLKVHNPVWLLFLSHPMPWVLRLNATDLGFSLMPQVLQSTMFAHSMREWSRVHDCFKHASPDVSGGRETLIHLMRTYVLVTQLAVRSSASARL